MERNTGITLKKEIPPQKQAITAFIGVVLIGGLGSLFISDDKMSESFPWMIAVAFMLVYAIFNSVLWITSKKMMEYFSESVMYFVILAVASGLFAFLITGKSPGEVGSIKWIFIVMTLGYFVFMGIMGSIKKFGILLNNEEEKKLSGKYDQIKRRKKRR